MIAKQRTPEEQEVGENQSAPAELPARTSRRCRAVRVGFTRREHANGNRNEQRGARRPPLRCGPPSDVLGPIHWALELPWCNLCAGRTWGDVRAAPLQRAQPRRADPELAGPHLTPRETRVCPR
jgi:hypothetical protein